MLRALAVIIGGLAFGLLLWWLGTALGLSPVVYP